MAEQLAEFPDLHIEDGRVGTKPLQDRRRFGWCRASLICDRKPRRPVENLQVFQGRHGQKAVVAATLAVATEV